MTVPGVGPITSLTFAAAIDDSSSFQPSRDVGAYLNDEKSQSGTGKTHRDHRARDDARRN